MLRGFYGFGNFFYYICIDFFQKKKSFLIINFYIIFDFFGNDSSVKFFFIISFQFVSLINIKIFGFLLEKKKEEIDS